MYYIVYKITNKINNKFYIGYHSTQDLNDDYMGSGKIIKESIKKHGITNFIREILYIFDNKEEALQKEKEIVDLDFIKRADTYNIKIGGKGGWEHTYSDDYISKRRIDGIRKSFESGRSKGWQLNSEQRSNIGKRSFKDKKHSEESKEKIKDSQRLDTKITECRIKDFTKIEKKYGYINKLSKKWGVSHTQVRRFLKNNKLI